MNAVIDIQRLVPAWQSLQSVATVTHLAYLTPTNSISSSAL